MIMNLINNSDYMGNFPNLALEIALAA